MGASLGTVIVIALIAIPCYFGLKRIARSFSRKGGNCGCESGSGCSDSCNCESSSESSTKKEEESSCCCCGQHDGDCCDDQQHENDGKFNANCTHTHTLNGTKRCCHEK